MHVAVISTPFVAVPPPRYGGTELVVAMLVQGLAARGHQVTLYATADSRVPARVRSFFKTSIWPPEAYRELTHVSVAMQDILLHDNIDVIHAHSAPALVFARMVGLPLVYTVHHERAAPLNDLYRAHQASNVTMVCISQRQRDLISDVFPAEVVYHGLDPRAYELGWGGDGYAAFIGRFAAEKAPHVAIDAALAAGVPIRLAGAPHWKDEAYFRGEVEPRLHRPGVRWVGELSLRPKSHFLRDAVATLMPIDWEEPFGLVMVESMLCGTPVLAFPRGSVPEVVDEGITGFVVADVDHMAARLRQLARGELGFDRRRCRAHAARRFSRDRMVESYLDVYVRAAAATGVELRA